MNLSSPIDSIIRFEGVKKLYRDGDTSVAALDGVDLEVARGEMLCVFGPSGSGKSTLLSIMGGLLTPSEGNVFFDGNRLVEMNGFKRARFRAEKVGFVFQEAIMLENLAVWENVAVPLLLGGRGRGAKKPAVEALKLVGLEQRINSRPSILSLGQRKRVEIARALVSDPQVILADEPTSGLDRKSGDMVMKLLSDANQKLGKTVVFVTHDECFVNVSNRKIEIRDGKLVKN